MAKSSALSVTDNDAIENLHEPFMRMAIDLALLSAQRGGHAAGAIIVRDKSVIGKSIHEGLTHIKAVQTPVSIALEHAKQVLGVSKLEGCTMYVTHFPSITCSYLIRESWISSIVLGENLESVPATSAELLILTTTPLAGWSSAPDLLSGILSEEINLLNNFL